MPDYVLERSRKSLEQIETKGIKGGLLSSIALRWKWRRRRLHPFQCDGTVLLAVWLSKSN